MTGVQTCALPISCTACAGQGKVKKQKTLEVKIPAGIAEGQRLRRYGEGEHGAHGGPSGDLYVVVHVKPHPLFQRENDDLLCEVPVPFPMMAMGGIILAVSQDAELAQTLAMIDEGYFSNGDVTEAKAIVGRLLADGEPYLVKGLHYSPWPPGTGPADPSGPPTGRPHQGSRTRKRSG